jgi:hypothetical protein
MPLWVSRTAKLHPEVLRQLYLYMWQLKQQTDCHSDSLCLARSCCISTFFSSISHHTSCHTFFHMSPSSGIYSFLLIKNNRLLWHGHQVMFNQLTSWMVYGILHDQYSEFFIRRSAWASELPLGHLVHDSSFWSIFHFSCTKFQCNLKYSFMDHIYFFFPLPNISTRMFSVVLLDYDHRLMFFFETKTARETPAVLYYYNIYKRNERTNSMYKAPDS